MLIFILYIEINNKFNIVLNVKLHNNYLLNDSTIHFILR